jgi:hypothetical protein
MGDAQIECSAAHVLFDAVGRIIAKVVPQPKADRWQF